MHELIEFCDESWTINIFDSFLYTFLRAEVYFCRNSLSVIQIIYILLVLQD